MIPFRLPSLLILVCCLLFLPRTARTGNPPNLHIIESVKEYRQTVQQNPNKELIDLQKSIPGIVLDIRYAIPDNFTKQAVYKLPKAYLRKPAAEALKKVQAELAEKGLGLKIFDGYRPYRTTVQFWELVQNKRYVADPKQGSKHNRGCAVDVTLVRLADGQELEMPTGYDSFEKAAAPNYRDLPKTRKQNRNLLIDAMHDHGFRVDKGEWWHFNYKGWERYELLDIPFEDLEQPARIAQPR
jgi:D-alanyl-D-alanine dipeptidase